MSFPDKFIVFLGRTFSGHHHDYNMLKQEFPPELDWFEDIHVRVDLGYQGIQSDDRGDQIDIPTKKPRKSQKNPTPQLNDEQKAAHKALSQVRIFISMSKSAARCCPPFGTQEVKAILSHTGGPVFSMIMDSSWGTNGVPSLFS